MLQKDYGCTATLGPLPEAAAAADEEQQQQQQQQLQQLAQLIIEEDREIMAFEVNRKIADEVYRENYLDEFGIPADLQTVRICAIRDCALNANEYASVRYATALLTRMCILHSVGWV
ncbi:tryptophanyl-tRNA synthetase, putative [Eimeria praecox]|uniref:Tryptophanyl-tRNA synthetase, putative n=1 Tax=Eimeria praecox TaxID=51316 RepID=U6G807_9EIME|nr:tryptophanyl-tRNA synthetase, putative [Eimeria praecox]